MNGKKLFMLTFAIFLILAGSAAAWFFFWHDLPKKTPLRAKQVMLFHLEQPQVPCFPGRPDC
ncbi:hypothetical protein [Sporolituus thermophilus]|uniref:Uncharacterized protein n=1 Tax=Sporolituus thermophilus DSM 23256 TaxID=1123285 RepID=A0A1G7JK62_9FIRM|nr:hypothetical protein [Sporolituus thermophilus]SDF25352.1 hypothetical protein SAMN05660235_00961 [Sporolituus thermophilus DSM 23256]